MNPGKIILVRHGQTALNAAFVLQPPDTPLSDVGRAQAARLATRLAGMGVARVLCSDFPRAVATAQPIVAMTGAPVEHSALLQERNFGELRGTPYADLEHDVFARDYAPPGGESWPEFEARVARAFDLVALRASDCPGNLVVVTHGLVCRTILRRHVTVQGEAPSGYGNTAISLIAARSPHALELANCSAHLAS